MTTSDRSGPIGGVVLAGGASSRLGVDKARIEWHGSPLVERVARLLKRGIGGGPVVIVGPHGTAGDPFDTDGFLTAADPVPDSGPLIGLVAGLEALAGRAEAAVVVPCDVPLLHPAVVRAMAEGLVGAKPGTSAALPVDQDGRVLPLPGAWSTGALAQLGAAVARGERSPARVAAGLERIDLAIESLAATPDVAHFDPELLSLRDVDSQADLDDLFEAPPRVRLARDGRITTPTAWTLGSLASHSGGDPEGPCVVNGLPVEFDPRFPLAARDAVSLPATVPL